MIVLMYYLSHPLSTPVVLSSMSTYRVKEEDLRPYFVVDETGQSLEDRVQMINSVYQEMRMNGEIMPIYVPDKQFKAMATQK